jgi:hypothetical protein
MYWLNLAKLVIGAPDVSTLEIFPGLAKMAPMLYLSPLLEYV